MEFRRLVTPDLDSYFANRLRALEKAPSAFLTTFAEEKARGNSHFASTLAHTGNDKAIFGAIEDGKVVGTIGLFQESRPKLSHKAVIWGMYVDEESRSGGIGGKLLDLAIQHARSEMKVAGIYLSVESNNSKAKHLYESRGFNTWGAEPKAMFADGVFFDEDHMVLFLNATGNYKLRTEKSADAGNITTIHDFAFNNKGEGRLVNLIRESEAFVPDLSIVAEQNGNLIGHVLFSKIALIENGRNLNCLSLAPVAVVPQHQRNGIGTELIREGINRARALGFSSILVLGDPKYYKRFGFQHELAARIECKYQCKDFQGIELKTNSLVSLRSASAVYPEPFTVVD